jgi:hypothetical protein
MVRQHRNIENLSFNTVIIMIVLFFVMIMCFSAYGRTPAVIIGQHPAYISVSSNNAVPSLGSRVHVFQQTWILNKDNFNVLAFNRNPISESKKAGLTIARYQKIRQSSGKIPEFILRYHLFPVESDDFPVLG